MIVVNAASSRNVGFFKDIDPFTVVVSASSCRNLHLGSKISIFKPIIS